jgi:hypothetical protein
LIMVNIRVIFNSEMDKERFQDKRTVIVVIGGFI